MGGITLTSYAAFNYRSKGKNLTFPSDNTTQMKSFIITGTKVTYIPVKIAEVITPLILAPMAYIAEPSLDRQRPTLLPLWGTAGSLRLLRNDWQYKVSRQSLQSRRLLLATSSE